MSDVAPEKSDQRAEELFREHQDAIYKRTDRLFAALMAFQWVAGIAAAVWISPRTWAGVTSSVHIHVWAGLFLGGVISLPPILLAIFLPGRSVTRYTIAVSQMLTSALLIHLTGGRIETHFHVFGSLAFLAFYRNWRVLIPATIVIAVDHLIRGMYWPQSVYGVLTASEWRWLEHAGWVIFEDIFLIKAILQSMKEMKQIARREVEHETRHETIEREVKARTEELTLANKKLREAERIKDEFLANVSHELRTPLTLVLAPLETLLSENGQSSIGRHQTTLQTMHNNGVRLLQMVMGLLDFSKLEAGKIEVEREPTDIATLTRSILDDFQPIFEQKELIGSLNMDPAEIRVAMDRYIYERILFNLLSNAAKFTPAGGRVDVSVRLRDSRLQIAVADTGIGIKQKDLQHLFQKFSQVEGASTRRFEGSGLGLALVKQFSGLLGGDVSVESTPGKGTTFTVQCDAPAVDEVPDEVSRLRRTYVQRVTGTVPKGAKPASVPCDGLPKLLIAEDNMEMAGYVAELLREMAEVRIARDGEEALEIVRAWKPDLLLADVMMPKRDGFSLCREVKSDPKIGDMPVVLLTAMTNREALLKGWEAGADEYLYKPFHPRELLMRIRTILTAQQHRRQAKRALELRTLELERSNSELEQFAYIASHDLQEPLRTVTSFTVLLKENQENRLDAESEHLIDTIIDAAKRMSELIHDLLNYSRVGQQEKKPVPVDLTKSFHTAVFNMKAAIEQSRAKVTCGPLPTILANESQITQLLQNLVGNAIKYRLPDRPPEIHVSAERKEEECCLAVRDNGIGIDPRFRDRILQIFRRVHDPKKYQGTGVGLAICKKIVEQLGGRIWVESEVGNGSTFYVTIPTKLTDEEELRWNQPNGETIATAV